MQQDRNIREYSMSHVKHQSSPFISENEQEACFACFIYPGNPLRSIVRDKGYKLCGECKHNMRSGNLAMYFVGYGDEGYVGQPTVTEANSDLMIPDTHEAAKLYTSPDVFVMDASMLPGTLGSDLKSVLLADLETQKLVPEHKVLYGSILTLEELSGMLMFCLQTPGAMQHFRYCADGEGHEELDVKVALLATQNPAVAQIYGTNSDVKSQQESIVGKVATMPERERSLLMAAMGVKADGVSDAIEDLMRNMDSDATVN